jgi:hypothetical protein
MRGFLAGLLLVVGVVLVPLADLGLWTQRQLVPTDAFVDLTIDVLGEPEVQQALADRLTEELVAREPRLGSSQALLNPAIRRAIDTQAFDSVLRFSIGGMHAQLQRGDDRLSLDFDPALPVVRTQVAAVSEDVAAQIPSADQLPSIVVIERDQAPQLWEGVQVARRASWAAPAIALVVLVAAVALARNRGRMLVAVGIGLVLMSVALVALIKLGRDPLSDVVGSQVSVDAFDAGYDVVTGGFVVQTVILAIVGIVSAIAGMVWMSRSSGNERPAFWA